MLISAIVGHLQIDFEKGDIIIPLKIKNRTAADNISKIKDKLVDVEIKLHRKRRSLNANAYAWKLIGEIAEKLNTSKEDVYLECLKRYGQSECVSIIESVNPNGYLKYYEEMGTGIANGKNFIHYRVFKGSSEYDTKEMSVFIDGIVEEAKELGIPTLDDIRIKEIVNNWENQY